MMLPRCTCYYESYKVYQVYVKELSITQGYHKYVASPPLLVLTDRLLKQSKLESYDPTTTVGIYTSL